MSSITSPSGLFAFTHDLMGRTTSLTHPNNDVISYQYNAASQLTGISAVGIVNTSYGYERDAAGRITRWSGDGSDWFYQYDTAGRLVRADHGQDNFAYSFDPLGNILNNGRTHDIANRLLQDNDYTYTYDQNGNLTKKQHKATGARTAYTWNARNQLARADRYVDAVASTPSKTLAFSYDSFGRRVSKTEDGVQERYVYDGNDLIAEIDNSGAIKRSITFGPGIDQPLGATRPLGTQFYYANHQGSIMHIADDSNIQTSYTYDPYGVTGFSGDASNRFGFTAREQDADDLYYYRERYYNQQIFRFISEDPIGLQGGLNLYSYVQNNPINKIDPYGLFDWVKPIKYWGGFFGGAGDFYTDYQDMRDANTIGADKYFHCMANCEAARRGLGGRDVSELISETRELTDEYIKRDPRSACDADRAANSQGRNGDPNTPCSQVCGSLRPNGLDLRY